MSMFRALRIVAGVEKAPSDRKKSRKGYSLAELILGAAVIAAFLVRIYQAYAATSASDRFEDFTSEIGLINGTVHQQFINSSGYGATGTDLAPAIAGQLPRKYVTGDGTDAVTVHTVYQTPVTIEPTSDGVGFTIQASLPRADCAKAVLGDLGRNMTGISVDSTAVNLPVTGTDASSACNSAGDPASLTFTFDDPAASGTGTGTGSVTP